jgi:hypothetical protein
MIDNFEERLCEAHCCAAKVADEYVKKESKGRASEQDFITLILLDQYLDTLDRYKKSISLDDHDHHECGCEKSDSCISENQARFILEQITTICGACSCNC